MDQAPLNEKKRQFLLRRKGWLERLQLGYRGREPSEAYALSSSHVLGVVHDISSCNLLDLANAANRRVAITLDLGGMEISLGVLPDLVTPLQLTHSCTVRRGTILLPCGTQVRITSDHVCFEGITLRGVGTTGQDVVVEVEKGGALEMEGCRVEGGRGADGGAVRVVGSLHAEQSALHSKEGKGLLVHSGGSAVLQECTSSNNKVCGVEVAGHGSTVRAAHCRFDGNGWYNISCVKGAFASLDHTTSNGSRGGHGVFLSGRGSSMVVNRSTMNGNGGSGAGVGLCAILLAQFCKCNGNGGHGFRAYGSGCVVVRSSQAMGNKWSNAFALGGNITCVGEAPPCDLGGQAVASDGHIICLGNLPCDLDGQQWKQ